MYYFIPPQRRPWAQDLLPIVLFAFTAAALIASLGTPAEATVELARYTPPTTRLTVPTLVLPSAQPEQPVVSLESQQQLLKIINGEQ